MGAVRGPMNGRGCLGVTGKSLSLSLLSLLCKYCPSLRGGSEAGARPGVGRGREGGEGMTPSWAAAICAGPPPGQMEKTAWPGGTVQRARALHVGPRPVGFLVGLLTPWGVLRQPWPSP